MGALLRVAQGIIDEGVEIDDGYLSDDNDGGYDADHWMNDVMVVDNDLSTDDPSVSFPSRTRADVRFSDVVEIIQPADIFNTPPLRRLSDTFRSTRLRSPPPLRRQYSYDMDYDSDADTIVEEWIDPAISPTDLFFAIDGYDNQA